MNNNILLTHYKDTNKNSAIEFIKQHDQRESLSSCPPTHDAYIKSFENFLKNVKKLEKNKHRPKGAAELKAFLEKEYILPEAHLEKRVPRVTTNDELDMKDSLINSKVKEQKLTEKLVHTETLLKENITQLAVKETEIVNVNSKLVSTKLNLKRVKARENYSLNKIKKLEENVSGKCCKVNKEYAQQLERQLAEQERVIAELTESVEYLTDILHDNNMENRVVNIFDENSQRYNASFKTCVYELLKLHVSASKVGTVVESVLKLVNCSPNKLPSKPTVLNMNLQRLCLAHKQLTDVFVAEESTCLLTDETSKFGAKYMGYEASDSSGQLWVLGLREIETKSSQDTLKVFKEILSDLDNVAQTNTVSRDIVSHISATMSDRAATEMKFNTLLESYRKEVLPLTYHNYDRFSDEERSSLENLNNFFCGLHALVNYAETSQKCLLQVDKDIFDDEQPIHDSSFRQTSEPGSCRLVRTASKAFGEGSGGDEKSGCQGHFRTFMADFLSEKNMRSVPLKSYRGSRFNILFSNACSVFFLHEKMVEFLESYGAENRLLKAVLFDLKVPEYIAGVKALGLICKIITSPLWSILEDKTVSIADMNAKYQQLVYFFDEAVRDIDGFMTGQIIYDNRVVKDQFFECLIQPRPFDQAVHTYLEVILSALGKLAKRLYADHLPGGKLTTSEIKAKAAPKTSCFAESVFGQMDHMMRTKPNLSILAAEASIMFANNKTLEWLKSKEVEERTTVINKASRQVAGMRRKFKERINNIKEQRRIKMQEKIEKKEQAEREKIRKQERSTQEIVFHGLWQSQTEIDQMLMSYETNQQKVDALKAQLKFRKSVLCQVPETKAEFNITKTVPGKKSRKTLTAEELTDNLKSLVQRAVVKDRENEEEKHMLIGKRIKHQFTMTENGEKVLKWYTGKVISQVPWFRDWFNVIYDDDPAVYTLKHLATDLEREDLKILV